MLVEVVITGTGIPVPSPGRAGAGVLVRGGGVALQFDAGRATALRLVEAGTSPIDLAATFLTHHHSDHVVGLADVVLTRWLENRHDRPDSLTIVAPDGPAARFVTGLLDGWDDDLNARMAHTARTRRPAIDVRAFTAAPEPQEVWSAAGWRVSAVAVRHEPVTPAVAYRVDSPSGAVVISGDTRACSEVEGLAAGAAVLVHEAVLAEALPAYLADLPYIDAIVDYHAPADEVGALAARAGVGTLVLTHWLPQPQTPDEEAAFATAVRRGGFAGELIVARDLTVAPLRRP